MKQDVINLDAGSEGSVDLNDEIFGIEPRADILHRVVRWQRAKKQAGTHKAKSRGETAYSSKKIYRQKGTGGARHGARGANIFRGGGTIKGPFVRSHAHDLQKKIRKLGLKMALSAKVKSGELVILDAAKSDDAKTKALAAKVAHLGWAKPLVIDGPEVDANFVRAAKNIDGMAVLPSQGANVYDILNHRTLVVTKAGIEALEARLS